MICDQNASNLESDGLQSSTQAAITANATKVTNNTGHYYCSPIGCAQKQEPNELWNYLLHVNLSLDYCTPNCISFNRLFIKYVTLQRKKRCVGVATCPWVRVKIMLCDVTHVFTIHQFFPSYQTYNIHSEKNSSCKCHSRSLMNRRLIGENFE